MCRWVEYDIKDENDSPDIGNTVIGYTLSHLRNIDIRSYTVLKSNSFLAVITLPLLKRFIPFSRRKSNTIP